MFPSPLRLVVEGEGTPLLPLDQRWPCGSPRGIVAYMTPWVPRSVGETMWAIPCDPLCRAIFAQPVEVYRGSAWQVEASPSEILRAMLIAGAAQFVLVHNHTSGDPRPSPDDRTMTRELRDAGRLIHVPLHDHLIWGRVDAWYSFRDATRLLNVPTPRSIP